VITTQANTLASRLFPKAVSTAETTVFPTGQGLHPEERLQVRGAVTQRVREFAAGRACARAALAQLGFPSVTLLSRDDRLPIWPAGITGSITHTLNYCAAAIVPTSVARSIGLDAEPNEPLDSELISYVCSPEELSWLRHNAPEEEHGRLARLVFSAKEAVFKSQFPITYRYLEFSEVQVTLDLDSARFDARVATHGNLAGGSFSGSYLLTPELIVTGVLCPSGQ
jgi:4'-phosphopantetheinyl transferase EntD